MACGFSSTSAHTSISEIYAVAALAWLACEALCCLVRSAGHITQRYCRRPVAHPPRLQSEISGSCSPLEGDGRPPRRRTTTGPARVRFFFGPAGLSRTMSGTRPSCDHARVGGGLPVVRRFLRQFLEVIPLAPDSLVRFRG